MTCSLTGKSESESSHPVGRTRPRMTGNSAANILASPYIEMLLIFGE